MQVARARRGIRLARLVEPLRGVLAHRFEQAIPGACRFAARRATSRPAGRARPGRRRSATSSPWPTASAASSVNPPGEDRQPAKQRALGLEQQLVAPVDQRAQRLLARQSRCDRRRSAAGSDRRAASRSCRPAGRARAPRRARSPAGCRRARRHIVATAAAFCSVTAKAGCDGGRAIDEEPHGFGLLSASGVTAFASAGNVSGGQRVDRLARDVQRLAAGREDLDARRRPAATGARAIAQACHQVLAVVEDEQQRALAEVRDRARR